MFTKSKIQMIRESFELINECKEGFQNIMDKYTVEDGVFVFMNNQLFEATKGYLVDCKEYDDINEAIKEWANNPSQNAIRIVENKKFYVGCVKNTILECKKSDNVFDISNLTQLR